MKTTSVEEQLKKDGLYIVQNGQVIHYEVTNVEETEDYFNINYDNKTAKLYKESRSIKTFGGIQRGDTIYQVFVNLTDKYTEPEFKEVTVLNITDAGSDYEDQVIITIEIKTAKGKQKKFDFYTDKSKNTTNLLNQNGLSFFTLDKEQGKKDYDTVFKNYNNIYGKNNR